MTVGLLITMRDISAATHLSQVIRALRADPRFAPVVYAQQPASGYLSATSVPHTLIDLPPAKTTGSPEGAALRAAARSILDSEKPDLALVGLSTPVDGGIDEAVLAETAIPKFLLQDFWGEQNRFFGRGADVFLALDDIAAERNRTRFGVDSVITGSARHAAYATVDFPALRRTKRAALGLGEADTVIGYFGQALHHLPGYRRTVTHFRETIDALGMDFAFVSRAHPREAADQVAETMALFDNGRTKPVYANDGMVEDVLAVCDVVCSLFSNCTYDASFQNFFSPAPLSVPVSMLFDPDIAAYCRERVDLEHLPLHVHELVVPVYRPDDLRPVLERSLTETARREKWQRAKHFLPDPSAACGIILDALAQQAGAPATSRGAAR